MKATQCSVEGCESGGRIVRGTCIPCYYSKRKSGEIDVLQRPTVAQRLAAGLVRMPNGCLEWTRRVKVDGYGQINVAGKAVTTHRLAWELANGPIPEGLGVLHHCDNPPCCDPTHLFLGTQAENNADMYAKDRGVSANAIKQYCKHGHEFTDANTYLHRGTRHCKTCGKERVAMRKAAKYVREV